MCSRVSYQPRRHARGTLHVSEAARLDSRRHANLSRGACQTQSIKILFHMSPNAFLIYRTRSLVKACDFKFKPRTELLLYNWGQKINRGSRMWPQRARIASILRGAPSSICVWAGLSLADLITHGAGRSQDLAGGVLWWRMLTWLPPPPCSLLLLFLNGCTWDPRPFRAKKNK